MFTFFQIIDSQIDLDVNENGNMLFHVIHTDYEDC